MSHDAAYRTAGAQPTFYSRLEERARSILTVIDGAACVVAPTGEIVDCNDEFVRFHHFAARADCLQPLRSHFALFEVRPSPQLPLLPLELWPAMLALQGLSGTGTLLHLRRTDSGAYWSGAYGYAPILDDEGLVAGALVTAQGSGVPPIVADDPEDATRVRAMFDANQIGVWDWNVERGTLACSAVMSRMLGYSLDEITDAQAWIALIHQDDLERLRKALGDHLAGRNSAYDTELRLRAKNDAWRWIHARGQVMNRDVDGRAQRVMGIHLDITERKQTETALATSETRLRAVVDNVPVGIVLADQQGAPVFTNHAFRQILHLSDAESSTLGWMSYMPAAEREELALQQRALIAGEVDAIHQEFQYHRPGWDEQRVSAHIIRVDDPHADFTFVGIGEDVTLERTQEAEHQRLLNSLQQVQKLEAIGQLAGGIAHDFNNILAAVVGFSRLAMERHVDDKESKLAEYLRIIIAAGDRGRDLVAKMMAFSRREPMDAQHVADPLQCAREVATMLGEILPSSMRLSLEHGESTPLLRMEPIALEQSLLNLVVNARDAITGHGAITILLGSETVAHGRCTSCHAPLDGHQYVAIEVRDTGCGMTPQVIQRIFEPFFTTKAVGHGTGMGLAVLHGVVHQARGHVQVESAPGGGTLFRLLLRANGPDDNETQLQASATEAPLSAAAWQGLRILVVDDEPSVRALVTEILECRGVQVSSAADGRQALDLVRNATGGFDLVFTDQTMPRMTGSELLAALRESGIVVPIVLCSGQNDAGSRRAVAEQGAIFLAKPAEPDDILAAIALALGR